MHQPATYDVCALNCIFLSVFDSPRWGPPKGTFCWPLPTWWDPPSLVQPVKYLPGEVTHMVLYQEEVLPTTLGQANHR